MSSSASSSAGRRILSRFASPFSQKGRSISDFHIQADDRHKQYSPGETVKGYVEVRVVKPVRVTHLSVCLHGFVQVFRTPNGTSEQQRGNSNSSRIGRTQGQGQGKAKARGKKAGEYFGNGFASLFEDESVLCGEGRLQEGQYRFNFEVAFPDDMDLPSSIDFERGTISYMITATLTRPTTIAPVLSYDQKIYLVERVDIASLLPPKPRTITLEPVPRKRPRAAPKPTSSPTAARGGDDFTHTPSVSELSLDSRISGSVGDAPQKTISTTVELLKGACLRGDSFPVKISVSHSKSIRSVNGIIITMYRQARVDMHPALPLGPTTDGDATTRKYEDYYPSSLTGLGGLSLSGAGSSHVFRKDLAQTLVPLIIDPNTLTADINAKIRVPDDVFPTITTVPGAMISFKYYIEVVLDIQGKLSRDRYLSQHGGSPTNPTQPPSHAHTDRLSAVEELNGTGIFDTTPIRRERSVATCTFEVVVGTVDSDRKKGKAKARPPPDEDVIDTTHTQIMNPYPHTDPRDSSHHPDNPPDPWSTPHHAFAPDDYHHQWHMDEDYLYDEYYEDPYFEPPLMENEEGLSEKERLRRAEARLVPSQPPLVPQSSSGAEQPSAPVLHSEDYHNDSSAVAGPSQLSGLPLQTTAHAQSLPTDLDTTSGMVSDRVDATDDKQELHKRELQLAASAPPPAENVRWESDAIAGPSAPPAIDDDDVYNDDDDNGANGHTGHSSYHNPGQIPGNLPKYHR